MNKIVILAFLLFCMACRNTTSTSENSGVDANNSRYSADSLSVYVSGNYTDFFPAVANGIYDVVNKYIEEVNNAGGLLGKPIRLIKQDDSFRITRAGINASIAIEDPNHLITIGYPYSSTALPIARVYAKAKKLMVTTDATHVDISRIGGTIFQLCYNDSFQAAILSRIAVDTLQAKKVLVLTDKLDAYSVGLSKFFLEAIGRSQPSVTVKQFNFAHDYIDIEKIVAACSGYHPDLIFLPVLKTYAANIVVGLRAFEQLKNIHILGSDSWGTEPGTARLFFPNNEPNRYLLTHFWHKDIVDEQGRNEAIKKKIAHFTPNKEPYAPGVYACEFLDFFFEKAKQRKTIDNVELSKAIRGSGYESSTGRVSFDISGATFRNPVLLELSKDGMSFKSLVK